MSEPKAGDYRGEGESTEMFVDGAWYRAPFIRESTAHYYGYEANIREMKADGRWDKYLAWRADRLENGAQ